MEPTKESLARAQEAKANMEKEVDGLQEQLNSMQTEYDALVKNMEQEGREAAAEKVKRVREEINAKLERSMENNFANMQNRYKESKARVDNQKTDILRMNKIFRDVARHLGSDWRSVFEVLTIQFPPQVTDLHLQKIEAQRSFMQAYKALTTWRELAADKFDMMELVEALRKCNLHELAAATLETMTSE
jgi:exonuclease VII large subunit